MKRVIVQAHANIALDKYWGKRDHHLILPTKSSFSIILSRLYTTTTVAFAEYKDEFIINGNPVGTHDAFVRPIIRFLDLFRKHYKINRHFIVDTRNSFASAAGMASSASGFAALAKGLDVLCELNLSNRDCSLLARQGSGSACRSMFGGFVKWHRGQQSDGSDSYAEQLFDQHHWPDLVIVAVVVEQKRKAVSSREGMARSCQTSPMYQQWLNQSSLLADQLVAAVSQRDFYGVSALTETMWQGMRDVMLTTTPSLNYWTQATQGVMACVKELQGRGINTCATTDAGPNVMILCLQHDYDLIAKRVSQCAGVKQVIKNNVGGGPKIIAAE